MKSSKLLFIGALVIGLNLPVAAQEDYKQVVDQISNVIKSNAPDVETQVKAVYKEYKKVPEVIVGIGRAYYENKDYDNAQKYVDLALARDKTYSEAYVLAGDIKVMQDDGGTASALFEQAIYFDPKNPNGYRRYAQVNSYANPQAAVLKLEELREQRPDYPVDLIAADIFDKAGKIDDALGYYDKVDKAKMEDYQLVNYALAYFLKGNFEKSLEVSSYGNSKFPRNPALNRITFFDLTNLKRYEEALTYADILFNKSDDTKITESDYLYYGYAYLGNKNYDESIDMFQKSIETNEDNDADRNDARKNISEAYRLKGDYPAAIATYETYLDGVKKKTANDINTLATLYMAEASDTLKTADEQRALYLKADAIYQDMVTNMPSVAVFATLQRAHIGYALDPETDEGLAKPHYEKIIELINEKDEKDDTDNARLIESYRYLGYYYFLKDDKENSSIYWNKVLELDPDNEAAKQVLSISEE